MLKCTVLKVLAKKEKNNRMEMQGQSRVQAAVHLRCVQPPLSAFSRSVQRNMYNYKGYKKGSNINRQKYTELLFTCLSNVRKSSYTHDKKRKNAK